MSTKRAVQLASKLQHEENARLRLLVFAWAEESESWAKDMMSKYGPNNAQKDEAGFRLLYILNHYCPALHHFHRKPDPDAVRWRHTRLQPGHAEVLAGKHPGRIP